MSKNILKEVMSNQTTNSFQGSQPFITDKQFQNMSLDEIRNILKEEKEELKKDYKERRERRKLIKQYKKLTQAREKVRQGTDIKKELKKPKPKPKHSTKTVVISKKKKVKSFDEYFEECIRNRKIPKDTPPYLRKALERAILEHEQEPKKETILEYDQGLEKEKSAFENFATKYTIQGIPGLNPKEYFGRIHKTLRDFFINNRNIKFRMNLVTLMKKEKSDKIEEDKSYFTSGNLNNMKSTDVDYLLKKIFISY